MKILSWNLNGLLSCLKNDAFSAIESIAPDILCLQEIRTMQEPEILSGYWHFGNHSERDGYSGTAMLTKENPLSIQYGFDSTKLVGSSQQSLTACMW